MNGETVTRQRATTTTDRYGNVVSDWAAADELTIPGCAVAPGTTDEDLLGRTAVTDSSAVYVRGAAPIDVLPTDRLVVRGGTYEVDGQPADWRHPTTGRRVGWVIPLQKVVG